MSTLVSTPSASERFAAQGPAAVHHGRPATASGTAAGSKFASLLAHLVAAWRRRSEEAAYELALRRDPRLMHDLRMARTRAEWRK